MTHTVQPLRRLLAAFTFALVLALAAPAALAQQQPAERLAALDLTEAQSAIVQRHLAGERTPGTTWQLAAELTPTLSEAQKQTLFTRPERGQARDVQRRARPEGVQRPNRPERPNRAQRQDRPERPNQAQVEQNREAAQAAMRQALNLTAEQASALEAFHAERMEQMQARRAERQDGQRPADRAQRAQAGEMPAELAAILTPEQQEVWRVHQALHRHLMPARAGMARQNRQ